MPPAVVLIPEGTTPYDGEWPWKRKLTSLSDENPFAALARAKECGVAVESFWYLEDLWIAGHDRAEALREALAMAGADDVKVEICWDRCQLKLDGIAWQGRLDLVIEVALGLEPKAGPESLFEELAAAGMRTTDPGGIACSTRR